MRVTLRRARSRFGACLAAVLLAAGSFGCDEQTEESDYFGPLEVSYAPLGGVPYTNTVIFGTAFMHHPSGVPVTFFGWRWEVDGVDSGITTKDLPPSATSKNQFWRVSARADYGSGQTPRKSSQEFEILNSPPRITSITFEDFPSGFARGLNPCPSKSVEAVFVAYDPDGDPMTFAFFWYVNGALIPSATTAVLPQRFMVDGDQVRIVIAPYDSETVGIEGTVLGRARIAGQQNCPPDVLAVAGDGTSGIASSTLGAVSAAMSDSSGVVESSEPSSSQPTILADSAPTSTSAPLSVNESNVCHVAGDGSLVCSGSDDFGLTRPPEGTFTQVAVELDYACAIRAADLAIQCWGEPQDDVGQLAPPEGAFSQIDLGLATACGLRVGGEIACWGDDSDGQASPPEGQFVALDIADSYGCAIDALGAVQCWGAPE